MFIESIARSVVVQDINQGKGSYFVHVQCMISEHITHFLKFKFSHIQILKLSLGEESERGRERETERESKRPAFDDLGILVFWDPR